MNKRTTLAALVGLALHGSVAWAQGTGRHDDHAHGPGRQHDHQHDHHEPLHGGIVAPGKEADYELVARADSLQLYVRDHGKPRDVSRASARVTLLAGNDKQQVELKPAGDRLEARGSFKVGRGTKVVAVVSDGGRTLGTARFVLK